MRSSLGIALTVILLCAGFAVAPDARAGSRPSGSTGAVQPRFFPAPVDGLRGQYVVVLVPASVRPARDSFSLRPTVAERAAELVSRYGGEVGRVWQHALQGFSVHMSAEAARRLADDPAVRFVEQIYATQAGFETGGDSSSEGWGALAGAIGSPQALDCSNPDPRTAAYSCFDNWGLDRIDQTTLPRDQQYSFAATGRGGGVQVHVYTLDTGIYADHDDFLDLDNPGSSRVGRGVNATVPEGDPGRGDTSDCANNSHGTHVAGIIGSATYGVAKEVILHPVKFFDCEENDEQILSMYLIDGMEWIAAEHNNHPDHMGPGVVNLSGGNGSANQDPLDSPAVVAAASGLIDAGLVLVQAAGNQNDAFGDACVRSLGAVPELDSGLILVAGTDVNRPVAGALTDESDGRWIRETGQPPDPTANACTAANGNRDCGSNSGPCVDLWAPAAHIISTANTGPTDTRRLSGTSMAAPHVTGGVALYLQDHPTATPLEVKQAILDGATCGVLDSDPASPYYIGDGSPNLLLDSRLLGASCSPNLPPTATSDSFSTPIDFPLSIFFAHLTANDSDPEGGPLQVIDFDLTTAQGGTNNPSNPVGFTYTPPPGFVGYDSFFYTIQDDGGLTDVGQVTIEVFDPAPPGCEPVFGDSFDGGDTSAWAQEVTAGSGQLVVDAASAIVGPFGLSAGVSNAGDTAWVQDTSPAAETSYRASFHFRLANVRMGDGNKHNVLVLRDDDPSAWVVVVAMRQNAGSYQLRARTRLDSGTVVSIPWVTFSSAVASQIDHQVEVVWNGADPGQSNGSLTLSVDGSSQQLLALDNDGRRIDQARFGLVAGIDAGTQGVFAFDEFESCRN